MKTFQMTIIRDKARHPIDEITELLSSMRKRGQYASNWRHDDNNFYIKGTYACDCGYKFDKAYCDEDCS